MQVTEVMQSPATHCHSRESAQAAALAMKFHDCGALPITDSRHRPIGMVTDRDIMLVAAEQDRPLSRIPLQDIMSHQVFVCLQSDNISRAESIMARHRVRRVPVVDEDGHLVGMVALDDLAREQHCAPAGRTRVDRSNVAATLGAVVRSDPGREEEAGPEA